MSSALVATEKQNASVLLFPACFICAQNKSSSPPPAGLLRLVLHLYMHCPWILSLGCLCYHLTTSLENRSPSCSFHCSPLAPCSTTNESTTDQPCDPPPGDTCCHHLRQWLSSHLESLERVLHCHLAKC